MPHVASTRYAQALADAILDPKSTLSPEQAVTELRAFEQMFTGSAELRNVLLSPAVSAGRKRAVVARFAQSMPLSPLVRNFIYVIIDRRRADILDEVREALERELDERLGVARADVSSAAPLTAEQQRTLEAELSRLTSRKIRASYSVDPSLLGGAMARIGSTIYDGSVRARLEGLRARLTSR